MRRAVFGVGLGVVLAACNGGSVVPIDEGDANTTPPIPGATTPGATGPGGDTGPEAVTPSFQDDIVPLFYRSCGAGENACHSAIAYGASAGEGCRGWLALEDAPLGSTLPTGEPTGCDDRELYERLTELTAWQCYISGWSGNGNVGFDIPYVVPGDLEGSYVWQKVTGGLLCDLSAGEPSQPMPLTAELPAEDLALLEAWILAGAPLQDEPTVPADNEDPSCTVVAPAGAASIRYLDPIELVATASDPEQGDLTSSAITWTSSLLAGSLGGGSPLLVELGVPGTHTVSCTATDSFGATGTDSVTVEAVSPAVWLWHPSDGEVRYASNGPFPFITDASDYEDGDITASVTWESDLDGVFGYGQEVSYLPSVGTHTITATGLDADGSVATDSVTITVVP